MPIFTRILAAAVLAGMATSSQASHPTHATYPYGYHGPTYGYGWTAAPDPYKHNPSLTATILGLRHGCTHHPDHGWCRPVKAPIHRIPVQYYRYWPSAWYGSTQAQFGVQYPVVHMPTDTTQLGYYYQRVPTWQPNPGMIPNPPWPPSWHYRECGYGNYGCGAYGRPYVSPAAYSGSAGLPAPNSNGQPANGAPAGDGNAADAANDDNVPAPPTNE